MTTSIWKPKTPSRITQWDWDDELRFMCSLGTWLFGYVERMVQRDFDFAGEPVTEEWCKMVRETAEKARAA